MDSENNQEVAELDEVVDNTVVADEGNDVEETQVEEVENEVTEEPVKPVQDEATRRMYADLRRQKEQTDKQNQRLQKVLQNFDFKGKTPDEIADEAEAYYQQKDVSEIRREREERERKEQEELQIKSELEDLRRERAMSIMEKDLKDIQKIDPTVKDLNTLGDRYFQLIKAGVSGVDAFNAIRASDSLTKKTPPKEIGKVNSSNKADKTYFTEKEVDDMIASGSKELDNPKVLSLIEKSMTKW